MKRYQTLWSKEGLNLIIFYCLNKENKLYYGNQLTDEGIFSQLIQSTHSKIIEENDYIYIFHMNEESNWKYIVTIPKSKLFNTIMPVIIAILMTILISYVIIIGATSYT